MPSRASSRAFDDDSEELTNVPAFLEPYQPPEAPGRRAPEQAVAPVEPENLVLIVFRAPRKNFRQLLWQLIGEGAIARNECYSPRNLNRWTLSIAAKVRYTGTLGSAMRAATQRLQLVSQGPAAFCLDGFYHGAAEFGNIFGEDAAPKLLVQPAATPTSLRMRNGDNVFMSARQPN